MIFLVNCSNIKSGGGLQVAQSVCQQLHLFIQHRFIVVASSFIDEAFVTKSKNIEVVRYNIKHNFKTIILGRDIFLDNLVSIKNVDAVLTVFGPSLWIPRVPHLCGFARAQLVIKDSPYYKNCTFKDYLIFKIWNWCFKKCSKYFYTENKYISHILEKEYKGVKVFTVSNYYSQVFDMPEKWKNTKKLPDFDGITCLSVSTASLHKNFGIIEDVLREMHVSHPGFNVRFVLTFEKYQWPMSQDVMDCVEYLGSVDISECPYLYEQADIMFMPTLLECFTATYPEAMRMEVPIVTTDLEFARGLCGEAACYYSSVDAKAAAEAIYKVATDKKYAQQLIDNGKKQLLKYDNYEQRADKLVKILEEISID